MVIRLAIVPELIDTIMTYIEPDDPRLIIWMAKAEDILEKVRPRPRHTE